MLPMLASIISTVFGAVAAMIVVAVNLGPKEVVTGGVLVMAIWFGALLFIVTQILFMAGRGR